MKFLTSREKVFSTANEDPGIVRHFNGHKLSGTFQLAAYPFSELYEALGSPRYDPIIDHKCHFYLNLCSLDVRVKLSNVQTWTLWDFWANACNLSRDWEVVVKANKPVRVDLERYLRELIDGRQP